MIKKAPELNYMTQIVFMLFEDISKPEDSLDKYHVDIHFSPGIKGRAELCSTDGASSTLLKKSSPELPEKLPQFFVKRLSHVPVVGVTESGAASAAGGVPTAICRTKPAGDGLSSIGGVVAAPVPPPGGLIHGGDFFRRYVTGSRSNALFPTSSSSGLISSSPKETLGRRRDSVPNTLRSFSDTKLVDRASKAEGSRLKGGDLTEGDGSGQQHRKKSASDSLLESVHGLTFGIGPTSHRYVYLSCTFYIVLQIIIIIPLYTYMLTVCPCTLLANMHTFVYYHTLH